MLYRRIILALCIVGLLIFALLVLTGRPPAIDTFQSNDDLCNFYAVPLSHSAKSNLGTGIGVIINVADVPYNVTTNEAIRMTRLRDNHISKPYFRGGPYFNVPPPYVSLKHKECNAMDVFVIPEVCRYWQQLLLKKYAMRLQNVKIMLSKGDTLVDARATTMAQKRTFTWCTLMKEPGYNYLIETDFMEKHESEKQVTVDGVAYYYLFSSSYQDFTPMFSNRDLDSHITHFATQKLTSNELNFASNMYEKPLSIGLMFYAESLSYVILCGV
jgi:hypothetical protein